jgi:hypothetical protein
MVFPQVTALPWTRAAATIPSISLPAHRLAAFLHKSSTASCTGKVSQQDSCRARGHRRSWTQVRAPHGRHP